VIRIAERAQLAFGQDILPGGQGLIHDRGGVDDHRFDLLALFQKLGDELVGADPRFLVQMFEQDVLDGKRLFQPGAQARFVVEIGHLHPELGVFVRIKGRHTFFSRTKLAVGQPLLLVFVEEEVEGKNDLGPVRNAYCRRGDVPLLKTLEFLEQGRDIQSHARTDDVHRMGIENARRQKVQYRFPEVVDDGVAGIVAALKSNDDVRLGGQKVRDFAFAFVAPIGAHDRSNGHGCTSL
jgi:hypothetical protein